MFDTKSNIYQTFLMKKSQHPVSQRIKYLIDNFYGGSVRKFCLALDYKSSQKINRLFGIDKRTNKFPKPTIDIIDDISNKLDINKIWLTDGVGDYSKDNNTCSTTPVPYESLIRENEILKNENQELFRENRELYQKLLKSKDEALDKSLSPHRDIVNDKS